MQVDDRSANRGTIRDPDGDAPPPIDRLPYGPRMTAALPALYRGFLVINRRLAGPALRAGLGPLFATPLTGSMMLLRTHGRTSGLLREAPLGYLIRDGAIYCVAGFGARTHWYRNILVDSHVECVLPTVALSGTAEIVTDPLEWAPAYRALIGSMGVIGRLTVGDVADMSEQELDAQRAAFPLIRIRPTGIAPGAFDPGGLGWIPAFAISTWATLRLLGRLRRGRRPPV
ncbi:MAG TPA: nitroreductase/quinone reductase family protein [Candidatus Limnocylindrales bacterium]|nr:nitroreductase/quinone reductase family protein [Candidatus Limnocylindrales bacterium]